MYITQCISEEVWVGFTPQRGTQNLQRCSSRFFKLVTTWDLHSSVILQNRDNLSVPSSKQDVQDSSWTSWPSNKGPIGCPETSVQNYHFTLCNTPEERRSRLRRSGSLKSRICAICLLIYSCIDRGIFSRSLWLENWIFWQSLLKAFHCSKCTT